MKLAAAQAAVNEVQSGMVVGLGTGTTAAHAVAEIGRLLAAGALEDIVGIPTSIATHRLAASLEIPLIEPDGATVDLAIDGADEIAPRLALTKGGGGALLREKMIAAAASRFVVIADDSKLVAALGSKCDIPLEVARFGLNITSNALSDLGKPQLRTNAGVPFVTDNGNWLIDLHVDPVLEPGALDGALHHIPGVLATGLFIGIADMAYIGAANGVRRMDAADELGGGQ